MSRVRVKICGITRKKDLAAVIEAGADAVGFVIGVPSSPRNLTLDEARKMIKNTIFVKTVVVTVPNNLDKLKKIHESLRPDILQIHGDRLPDPIIREELPKACLIRAVQVTSNGSIKAVVDAANNFDAILSDSYVLGKYGGTGKTHDWKLDKCVREAIQPKPLILAGGLNPTNIKDAIRIVQPYAVDVSSGVESHPGIKDPKKIYKFIKKVKEAEIC